VILDASAPPTAGHCVGWAMNACDDVLAIYKLNHARDWSEVRNAIRGFGVPAQYLVYADASGLGVSAMGRVPQRAGASGMLPTSPAGTRRRACGVGPFLSEALPTVWQHRARRRRGRQRAGHARNAATYASSIYGKATRVRGRIAQLLG
jgi:hypothetical protein